MDTIYIISLAALVLALALMSFFFSASETAIIGLSKIRLRHMISQGKKGAQNIQRLLAKLDKFIAAILIGNDFVNIAISAIATAIFVHFFGYKLGVVISTFVATFFVLIMCEITPKMLASKQTEKVAVLTAPLMEIFIKIFHPIILIFTGASNLILKMLRIDQAQKKAIFTKEELRLMIEIGKEEGFLNEEERKMLQRIFEFGNTKVSDIMAPKDKMTGVSVDSNADEILDIFAEIGYVRLPVYKDSIDNVIGIIYASDLHYLLRDKELFVLQDLINEAFYVDSQAKVSEVLKKFQQDKVQIAIVIDKEKKAVGLVTLEDLIEEIVGELEERPRKLVNHKSKV